MKSFQCIRRLKRGELEHPGRTVPVLESHGLRDPHRPGGTSELPSWSTTRNNAGDDGRRHGCVLRGDTASVPRARGARALLWPTRDGARVAYSARAKKKDQYGVEPSPDRGAPCSPSRTHRLETSSKLVQSKRNGPILWKGLSAVCTPRAYASLPLCSAPARDAARCKGQDRKIHD